MASAARALPLSPLSAAHPAASRSQCFHRGAARARQGAAEEQRRCARTASAALLEKDTVPLAGGTHRVSHSLAHSHSSARLCTSTYERASAWLDALPRSASSAANSSSRGRRPLLRQGVRASRLAADARKSVSLERAGDRRRSPSRLHPPCSSRSRSPPPRTDPRYLVFPSPAACCVVAWMHRAMLLRSLPSSRQRRPAMVQPPGAAGGREGVRARGGEGVREGGRKRRGKERQDCSMGA